MASQPTNAGRDQVEVHNRLDAVVVAIRDRAGHELATPMTPDEARALAELLRAAADTGERTPGS